MFDVYGCMFEAHIHKRSVAWDTHARSTASNIHTITLVGSQNLSRILLDSQKPSQAEGFWTYASLFRHVLYAKTMTGRGLLQLFPTSRWKLQKSSFDQALQNASKHFQKLRFGNTFWSRQDIWVFGVPKPPIPKCMYACMYVWSIHTYIHTHYSPVALI